MTTPVKYIGKKKVTRERFTDERVQFHQGETVEVVNALARRLLSHPTEWAPGLSEDVVSDVTFEPEPTISEDESILPKAKGSYDNDLIESLVDAIELLDTNQDGDFSKSTGLPLPSALNLFVGFMPKASDIKEAFRVFNEK